VRFQRHIRAKGSSGDHVRLIADDDEKPVNKPWQLRVAGRVRGSLEPGEIAVVLSDRGLERLREACDDALAQRGL
jgi:hypothetical protein